MALLVSIILCVIIEVSARLNMFVEIFKSYVINSKTDLFLWLYKFGIKLWLYVAG
jgi:hypothetical protein